jgi:mRNA-degrading endonuclease RelE of RelBE toxin-antitoxin system
MKISFEELPEFQKDLKRLLKKYRTLTNDIKSVQKGLNVYPDAFPPYSFRLEGLGIKTCVIKIKKIASASFKGKGVNSGFRLIYAYYEQERRIVLVELYHKNEKVNEDRERIFRNFE